MSSGFSQDLLKSFNHDMKAPISRLTPGDGHSTKYPEPLSLVLLTTLFISGVPSKNHF